MVELVDLVFPFGLTLFAGLATGFGSLIAFFTNQTNKRFLAVALGFSAGVMIYVSFVEILPKGIASLTSSFTESEATILGVVAFFVGIFFIGFIDMVIPSAENPHEVREVEEMFSSEDQQKYQKEHESKTLLRMGVFTALAIGIHNFPEGLVTFISALDDASLGVAIALAVAIHNIPEGIAVSVPIFYATGDRKKAFIYSFMSGVSEPIGAVVGYFLLVTFLSDTLFGMVFSFVGGIMVFISLDELLPSAEKYGEHHLSIYGLVAGMIVMATSLILFL